MWRWEGKGGGLLSDGMAGYIGKRLVSQQSRTYRTKREPPECFQASVFGKTPSPHPTPSKSPQTPSFLSAMKTYRNIMMTYTHGDGAHFGERTSIQERKKQESNPRIRKIKRRRRSRSRKYKHTWRWLSDPMVHWGRYGIKQWRSARRPAKRFSLFGVFLFLFFFSGAGLAIINGFS